MRVIFSPEARLEFEDAECYYDKQVEGLGGRFRAEVKAALSRASMAAIWYGRAERDQAIAPKSFSLQAALFAGKRSNLCDCRRTPAPPVGLLGGSHRR